MRKIKVSEDGAYVENSFAGRDGCNKFSFGGAEGNGRLCFRAVAYSSTTESEDKTGDRAACSVGGVRSINERDQLGRGMLCREGG